MAVGKLAIITAEIGVTITVRDVDALRRVLGPDGAEWRSHLYDLRTERDVFAHWARNALVNGIERVNQLDGWADMADDAATFSVVGDDFDSVMMSIQPVQVGDRP